MYTVQLVHAEETHQSPRGVSDINLANIIQTECPSLAKGAVFRQSPLVPGSHTQTIYAFLGYYVYYVYGLLWPKFTREVFRLADGGNVALDWALCDNHTKRPIVTILSGVTGTSDDFYVRKCYKKLIAMNYSVVVIHSRGCGGSRLSTSLPFHCGFTDDYREVVANIRKRLPHCLLLGLSFSLGANIMTKYVGEEGENCPLVAAISVGNPYDMYKVIRHLDSQFLSLSKVYDIAILNFLKTAFKRDQKLILSASADFDVRKISKSSTILEFTEEMTRKAFGYKSAKDLLDDSSCHRVLENIRIPMLFLNSLDDPICLQPFIPYNKFMKNPYLVLGLTDHGGHIGYMGNTWPSSWIEHPVSQFLQSMVAHYGKPFIKQLA